MNQKDNWLEELAFLFDMYIENVVLKETENNGVRYIVYVWRIFDKNDKRMILQKDTIEEISSFIQGLCYCKLTLRK
jgi:hypothetical protein